MPNHPRTRLISFIVIIAGAGVSLGWWGFRNLAPAPQVPEPDPPSLRLASDAQPVGAGAAQRLDSTPPGAGPPLALSAGPNTPHPTAGHAAAPSGATPAVAGAPAPPPPQGQTELPSAATATQPALAAADAAPQRPEHTAPAAAGPGGAAPAATSRTAADTPAPGGDARTTEEIESARRLVEGGKLLEARQQLMSLVQRTLPDPADAEVRGLLARVADETLFGRRAVPNDPLLTTHVVESGENLTTIGRSAGLPPDALAVINSITNPNALRVGQRLKIPQGTFHAKVSKSRFRLDLYLNDVFLRSYPVGLGSENGTPAGVWRVRDRIPNPTYYPSASAVDKRVLAPDDPNNPLGDYWIGLDGIEGAAAGQEGFGIHGTIEPDSIGKAVSLGCIRMYNEDVAIVFKLLTAGKSTVTVTP